MSDVIERLATRRDLPRWAVIVGLIATAIAGAIGHHAGDRQRQPEVDHLRARQAELVELVESEPVRYEGQPYEVGEHHVEHQAAEARFPTDRITWWVDPAGVGQIRPAVTHEQVRDAMRSAWALWAQRLDIEPVEVMEESEALVRHRFGFIDGSSRTLAWSTLTDGSGRPQEQRFDTGESWTLGPPAPGQVALVVVGCHEIGHAMGLGHDAGGADAIMRPTYTAQITRPTDRDIGRMVRLGYRQRVTPVPVPPSPGVIAVPATLRTADVVGELRRLGYTVAEPK